MADKGKHPTAMTGIGCAQSRQEYAKHVRQNSQWQCQLLWPSPDLNHIQQTPGVFDYFCMDMRSMY
eukprot:scaffold364026_cov38-Prasinocladus_malaysianus.AAC.1